MASTKSITVDDPSSIARLYLHEPAGFNIILGQIEERAQLVKHWEIQPGENVLELGCGQGDCTVTLAAVVGEHGHVTGVDPAPLDYGSPYTLGQAQAHLLASPLGARMTFTRADPVSFLASTEETYTTAVLAHCSYYFAAPDTFGAILRALAPRVKRICLAEWSLHASLPQAVPHILAVLAHASLQWHIQYSDGNVRTVLSPEAMREAARGAGLALVKEGTVVPGEKMLDAKWEVGDVLSEAYARKVGENVKDSRERAAVHAVRDSTRASMSGLAARGETLRCMDVWVATFIPSGAVSTR